MWSPKIYDDAFRPLELKVSQANILVATATMKVVRPADICTVLHMDVSTLSRNVERMKARGWLEVLPDEDGRAQPFQLTDEGHRLLKRAAPAWKKAQQKAEILLGDSIIDSLNTAVARVNAEPDGT